MFIHVFLKLQERATFFFSENGRHWIGWILSAKRGGVMLWWVHGGLLVVYIGMCNLVSPHKFIENPTQF
jgi:hypothetical protein